MKTYVRDTRQSNPGRRGSAPPRQDTFITTRVVASLRNATAPRSSVVAPSVAKLTSSTKALHFCPANARDPHANSTPQLSKPPLKANLDVSVRRKQHLAQRSFSAQEECASANMSCAGEALYPRYESRPAADAHSPSPCSHDGKPSDKSRLSGAVREARRGSASTSRATEELTDPASKGVTSKAPPKPGRARSSHCKSSRRR